MVATGSQSLVVASASTEVTWNDQRLTLGEFDAALVEEPEAPISVYGGAYAIGFT
jgi:hypothetical protein